MKIIGQILPGQKVQLGIIRNLSILVERTDKQQNGFNKFRRF